MANFFSRILDGSDRSVEFHALMVALGFVALCVFQGYALWHGQGFDPSTFGQALGVILGGGGAAAIGQALLTARSKFLNSKSDNPDA